jgi:hypothetical protein
LSRRGAGSSPDHFRARAVPGIGVELGARFAEYAGALEAAAQAVSKTVAPALVSSDGASAPIPRPFCPPSTERHRDDGLLAGTELAPYNT